MKPHRIIEIVRNLPSHPRFNIFIDLCLVLAMAVFILLLQFQGWRSREMVNPELVPYYQQAYEFITTGRLPDHGSISSYKSYFPPGAIYLIIPGVFLFHDARLQSLFGDTLIFLGIVAFTYLCAREIGGRRIGLASAIIVAISRMGFQTLNPIGNPFFIVSTLYFLICWIKNRSAWMLGIALVLAAFGVYHHMAVAIFFVIIPVLWLIYRPPVRWHILVVSIAIGFAIWFPYLRFEADRGFSDIKSQILRQTPEQIEKSGNTEPIYCYAALSGELEMRNETYLPYIGGPEIEARVIYPLSGWKNQAAYASCRLLANIDRNFDTELFLLGGNRILNTIVWLSFIVGWSALGWILLRKWKPAQEFMNRICQRKWLLVLAAILGPVCIYVLLDPNLAARLTSDNSLDRNTMLAVIQWRDFLPWIWGACILGLLLSLRDPALGIEKEIYFLSFTIPWILLMIVVEPGRPDRFWFMWPLQVMMAVLCLHWISQFLPRAKLTFSVLAIGLCIAVLPFHLYADRTSAALLEGYSGRDSDQWKVVLFLSDQARSKQDSAIQIEYEFADSHLPMAPGRYRVQDLFTYLLISWSGIPVHDLGPVSKATGGAWVVVESQIAKPNALNGIEPVAVFGKYQVYRLP